MDGPKETIFQLVEIGGTFIPRCYESRGLKFRKDQIGPGRAIGVCKSDPTLTQEFAEYAPVILVGSGEPAAADGGQPDSPPASVDTPPTSSPDPKPAKSKN